MQPVVRLKICRPFAGFTIALRCVLVKRGGKNPCVVEDTSNLDDGSGLTVPTPKLPPLL